MRIVLLNSVRRWGGGLTAAFTLARGLARHHHVTVACSAKSDLRRRAGDANFDIAPIRIGPDFDPFAALSFIRAVRRAHADVILVDRRKDVKLVYLASLLGLRTPAVQRNGAPSGLRDSRLYRAAWGHLRGMIVNSEAMRRQLLQESPWLRIPMDVIHNGVDTDRFQPVQDTAALREELGVPRAAFVIGYAGVFQPRKRVDMLVRAAAALPADTARHLLLVGDGPERPELEALAAHLDLPATFVGRRDDVGRILPAADVVAHLSAAEGFANSVLEALACGVPVIATDEHSHPEQIGDGVTGVLVPPDAAAVSDALTRLASDSDARLAMGRAARESALARFAVERMVADYVTVLARVATA